MSTNHHTVIATGASANAATVNSPLGQLDAAITDNASDIETLQNDAGGAAVSNVNLLDWAAVVGGFFTSAVYHGTYTWSINTGVIEWPDGSAGAYTVTARSSNANALGMVDAFTATHTDSGQTITQAAVTRNTDGNVTVQPALTIA